MPDERIVRVALVGNPNCGKTSVFNNLTGGRQHVANWPGVTVEGKIGTFAYGGVMFEVTDLPGTYSLSSSSLEEYVVERQLATDPPDIIINILDAANLERHLFLTAQLIARRLPMVLVANMVDEAEHHGLQININDLSAMLGVPVVPMVARRNTGTPALLRALLAQVKSSRTSATHINYGERCEAALARIGARVAADANGAPVRWRALLLLLGRPACANDAALIGVAAAERVALEAELGMSVEAHCADRWFGFAHGCARACVQQGQRARFDLTERLDDYLTHPVFGLLLFGACMWLTFELVFTCGSPLSDGIAWFFERLGALTAAAVPDGIMRSLLVDGIIGGVGGVVVFLPNILLLFLAIGFLEDSGYMARAAFVMDGIMHRLGLHGKSFIPMLVGFGCTVPAVMATRMLDSKRDRVLTALILPFMSCGARLPVYALFIGAFFAPRWQATVLMSLYVLGIIVAIVAANVLGRIFFRRDFSPLLMELPPYRLPTARSVLLLMWMRAWAYLRKAGTLLLGASILMWFLCAFPRRDVPIEARGRPIEEQLIAQNQTTFTHSYASSLGRAIEPVLRPLGFDWRIGVGLLTGVVAKEAVVSTLMIVYGVSDENERGTAQLQERLRADPVFARGPLAAFTLMVFVLLYVPCIATIAVFWREFGAGWMLFMSSYTTAVAWCAAFVARHIGLLLGG